ncbi:hypothetical protein HDU91_001854, partial [Kappamyces sp. JEL0680]
PILPPARLDLPVGNGDSTVFCSLFHSGHKIGLVAVGEEGLARVWDAIELPQQYQDAQLDMGGSGAKPLFLEQAAANLFLLGLDSGAAIKIELDSRIRSSFLMRNSAKRSVFGLFTTGGSISILSAGTDRLVGCTTSPKALFISTRRAIQKWISESFCWEVDAASLVEAKLESSANVHIVGMECGTKDSIVCLFRTELRNRHSYCMATFVEDQESLLSVSSFKRIGFTTPLSNTQCHFALSNGGAVGFISCGDSLVIVSPLSEIALEEVVPWKSKDLIGLGTVKSFHLNCDTVARALLCSSSGGVLEMNVSVAHLKKEVPAQPAHDETLHHNGAAYAKLEQIVFFSTYGENPIELHLEAADGDLNQPCLELSASILTASNPHLPNIIDEGSFLRESFHTAHAIIGAVAKNRLLDKVVPDE